MRHHLSGWRCPRMASSLVAPCPEWVQEGIRTGQERAAPAREKCSPHRLMKRHDANRPAREQPAQGCAPREGDGSRACLRVAGETLKQTPAVGLAHEGLKRPTFVALTVRLIRRDVSGGRSPRLWHSTSQPRVTASVAGCRPRGPQELEISARARATDHGTVAPRRVAARGCPRGEALQRGAVDAMLYRSDTADETRAKLTQVGFLGVAAAGRTPMSGAVGQLGLSMLAGAGPLNRRHRRSQKTCAPVPCTQVRPWPAAPARILLDTPEATVAPASPERPNVAPGRHGARSRGQEGPALSGKREPRPPGQPRPIARPAHAEAAARGGRGVPEGARPARAMRKLHPTSFELARSDAPVGQPPEACVRHRKPGRLERCGHRTVGRTLGGCQCAAQRLELGGKHRSMRAACPGHLWESWPGVLRGVRTRAGAPSAGCVTGAIRLFRVPRLSKPSRGTEELVRALSPRAGSRAFVSIVGRQTVWQEPQVWPGAPQRLVDGLRQMKKTASFHHLGVVPA